ncbi:Protein C05G5.5 a [Aphelenchoides avenae]|nr:Protein C05G5.5 a [Aphelenchus avenae]
MRCAHGGAVRTVLLFAILHAPVSATKTVVCPAAKSKSLFLWSVESPERSAPSFLFGTIHVPYNEVWEYVSDKVKEAFTKADSVVFELELQNPETIEALIKCKNLMGTRNLRDIIPTELYLRLKTYMRRFRTRLYHWSFRTHRSRTIAKKEARRLYANVVGSWETRRPVWLLFLLYQLSESVMQNQSMAMLDLYLARKAQDLGKKLRSIESPAEQCNPLLSVDDEQVLFAINYTLSYLEWLDDTRLEGNDFAASAEPRPLGDLIDHYRCGSLEAKVFSEKKFVDGGFSISPELDRKARQIDDLLREDIILKRNIRMATRAHYMLSASPSTSFFFAIGAGHFLGDDSMISFLEAYGYKVTAVTEDDDLRRLFRSRELRREPRFHELWVRDQQLSRKLFVPAGNHADNIEVSISFLEVIDSSSGSGSAFVLPLLGISPLISAIILLH